MKLINGGHTEALTNHLPQVLETIIEHELWASYLTTPVSQGGMGCDSSYYALSYEDLMELCRRFKRVYGVLAENAPKGKRGGNGNNQHKKKQELIGTDQFPRGGTCTNRSAVLSAKLAEHHPEVMAAFLAGEHKTVYAAAKAAGLVKDANAPLDRLKQNWKKATAAERAEFRRFQEENP